MLFKAKLNAKFYIVTVLLLGIVLLVLYGTYFLNVNEILMEDDTPMPAPMKVIMTVILSVVGLSWLLSLVTMIRQIMIGSAFCIDENGIHGTATAVNILAFLFIVPIQTIPHSAIQTIEEEEGVITLHIDKSRIDVLPFLRPFVRKTYRLFYGFTSTSQSEIKDQVYKYRGE